MKSLITGIKATGQLHLGNYLGSFKQAIEFQDSYDTYLFIANLHSLTTNHDGESVKQLSYELVLDLLSLGADPDKATIFMQSDVPEHSELTWILSCMCPMGILERAHAWKDFKQKGLRDPNLGLFSYPILMAADILIHQPDIVPVGSDQKQHLEIAQEIAKKFNNNYGSTFKIPKELITLTKDVPGIDGRKMSKSYNNYIPVFGSEAEIQKAIMKITTDSKGIEEKKDPESCNIFAIYKLLGNSQQIQNLQDKYTAGGVGYADLKKELLKLYLEYFKTAHEKRIELAKHPKKIIEILGFGAEKARKNARQNLDIVKEKTGV